MSKKDTAKAVRNVVGRVSSDKMDKTITIVLERKEKHPMYGKYISKRTKVHAHDERNECKVGDLVQVQECRPVSRNKSWKLVKIIERAPTEQAQDVA
jgi:small subunit ribosomal protein S17